MDKFPPRTIKVRVKQEYEVEIFYQEGILADSEEEVVTQAIEDCINLAFEEEGLVIRMNEETEFQNGYLANITTYEPTVELIYNVPNISTKLDRLLAKKGIEVGRTS
jgi:hypothetical protein